MFSGVDLLINGVFTGVGASIGSYIAQRAFIKNIEKIEKLGINKKDDH